MKVHVFLEKNKNSIITILTLAANCILFSLLFDFYYDLNDDVMMKDIMSGVYTGTPDGHNMQTLYLLGASISFFYRLCRSIPWYGLFLFLCQGISLYLLGARMLRFCHKMWTKAGAMLVLSVFAWGVLLPHLIAIQYTITSAIMASTAVFLFLTTEKGLSVRQFLVQNIPSMLLVILAYQLRTEMLLLVFPLICLAGLFRWMEEDTFFCKENYQKYGMVIGIILAGMFLSKLGDCAAYGSDAWKQFQVFFDKRTEVYDYHYEVLTSGEHADGLSALGLSAAQQELLSNYNFGLDESLDEKVMAKIARYAKENPTDTAFPKERITEKARFYFYRTLHGDDAPYNYMVILGYVCVLTAGICQTMGKKERKGKWSFLGKLVLLGLFRTVLWMYVLLMGRDPVRITHSLYLAEFAVLMGMLLPHFQQDFPAKKGYAWLVAGAFVLLFGCCLPDSLEMTLQDKALREEKNRAALAIAEYGQAHPDNFYYEDVYSTVGFSQKIFAKSDNRLANYDIMGGWMCKSPLYEEKQKQFGIHTMEEALLYQENVYLIANTQTELAWLSAYYEEQGIAVLIEQVDEIAEEYAVYDIMAAE